MGQTIPFCANLITKNLTLKRKNIPFREIHINSFSEETIGELFSYFMLETAMIAKLINVNPFNQPSVDEVKILTKKYLS